MNQHLLWFLEWACIRALQLDVWLIPHRQFCLPKRAQLVLFSFKQTFRIFFPSSIKQLIGNLTHLKFENRLKLFQFQKTSNHSLYMIKLICFYFFKVLSILRETSEGTSNSLVRLVFRPHAQIWQTICTSVLLRASIRVSSDFTLFRHSSPTFGSQHSRSDVIPSRLPTSHWVPVKRLLRSPVLDQSMMPKLFSNFWRPNNNCSHH